MTFYEKSIIYKIKHNEDYDDNNIYIGSTSNFKNRKYCHKSNCNNEKSNKYNYTVYQYIRANGNWEQFVMIPIEQYPCNNKEELVIRERHHIDLLRPILNIQLPTRTKKEHYEDNKEKIAEYDKKRYEANKEQIIEYKKQYYKANKEQITERTKKKVICDHCGCEVNKYRLKRHQKSNKCINFVKT